MWTFDWGVFWGVLTALLAFDVLGFITRKLADHY